MCIEQLPRQQIDALLFQVLKRVYRLETVINQQFGLNYQAIYLLQILRQSNTLRISDIATELHIPLFQVSRLVNKLAEKSLVARNKDASDSRVVLVSILPTGEQILQAIEENSYHVILANAKKLSADDVKAFLTSAAHIDDLLNTRDED